MLILPFRRTALHIHPLFPGLILFCLFTGRASVLWPVLALLLHESGHLLALVCMRKTPQRISLTPFGGLIDLPSSASLSPLQGFFLAFSGPLFSLLGCIGCLLICHLSLFSPVSVLAFFRANLLLMLFNLLPVLPLDGGRMVYALLSAFISGQGLQKALLGLGKLAGAGLIFLSIRSAAEGVYQFAPAFAGAYVLYACAMEAKNAPVHYYSHLIGRRSRMLHTPLPVQPMAVPSHLPLQSLLPRLHENRYHLFHVIAPDGMGVLGQLTEDHFCNCLMDDGAQTFAQALEHTKKHRFPN